MSLLTIVQTACNRVGITAPTTVSGSTDQQILQLFSLANEEGDELSERYPWSVLQKEAIFTTLAARLQGTVVSIAPGFKYIIADTIWNRSSRRPIYGSLSPQDWQMLQASPVTGPYEEYRIQGGNLYFNPIPAAGKSCAFEYMSENWCQSSGGTGQAAFALDADTGILPEKLLTSGLVWRWKRTKGLGYAEDFRSYEVRVADAMARDAGKPVLSLDGGPTDRTPGIVVPNGNWSL